MASQKGRVVNSWTKDIFVITLKVVVYFIYSELAKDLHGDERRRFVVGRFRKMFPFAQEYFEHRLSRGAIYGRAYTMDAATKPNERVDVNPKTRPQIPVAQAILHHYHVHQTPFSRGEFEKFILDWQNKHQATDQGIGKKLSVAVIQDEFDVYEAMVQGGVSSAQAKATARAYRDAK